MSEPIKVSQRTLEILKNFALINPNIIIFPGNVIRSKRDGGTAFAEAEVEENFPVEIPIYDISQFLSVTNLFSEPEYTFNEDHMLIKEGQAKQKFFYSDKKMIRSFRKDPFQEFDYQVGLSLPSEELKRISRAIGINQATHVTIGNTNNRQTVTVYEMDEVSGEMKKDNNFFKVGLGTKEGLPDFKIVLDCMFLRTLYEDDYSVKIFHGDNGMMLTHFVGKSSKLKYWFAVEDVSTWGDSK